MCTRGYWCVCDVPVAVLVHDNSVCSVWDYGVVFVNIVGVTVVILFANI